MSAVEEYIIYVSNPDTGSSSSYSSPELMECLQWAFAWAGVEFRVEGTVTNEGN